MKRRDLLISGIKLIPFGIGFTLIPNYVEAFFQSQDDDTYDFRAWEDNFQDLVKQKQLHGAVQSLLINTSPFSTALGKQYVDIELKRIAFNSHYIPELIKKFNNAKPVTPKIKLKTQTNHDFKGQVFELPDINEYTGIFSNISKKPGENNWNYEQLSYYVTYPDFHQYIGRKAYFCYGTPCEPPKIYICKQCEQEYATQLLFYNGNSIYDKGKTYGKGFHTFYANLSCSHPENSKFKQHDGLSYSTGPIDPCTCESDIKGTKNEIGT